eukprot:CAMPEP_0183316588 /NCGR_PEP_ID=MMETSP0160_2-20130417/55426_1 /TAXON_ID=2839 ORGANISM="Odontella Sinensis, Strain Grunow 1884" /NCGR_SAMPLE_ID=MMETSP0160_2 /ASSEMBLY_ACC=CAM_ASM_000250 /LENGTH=354 /DNA_ID=CAMNT_0025482429 /DNA_START=147 /DNA_END=1208 /DNA_ORIENTATION=+
MTNASRRLHCPRLLLVGCLIAIALPLLVREHEQTIALVREQIAAAREQGVSKREQVAERTPFNKTGSAEQYIMNNLDKLGFGRDDNPRTCGVWTDPDFTTPEVLDSLNKYAKDLENYTQIMESFDPVPNLMDKIRHNKGDDVCNSLRLHPDGIAGLFPSEQLSFTSSGYAEPLLPPMRHHAMCKNRRANIMRLDYLVHDFEFMCRKLKPTSRLVLLDMGASLDFHGKKDQPIITLLRQYEKMGFIFDHIYGFEVVEKKPEDVFDLLPEEYMKSYHWINVGVTAKEGDKLNPLHSIIKTLDVDDFVVVKLDIDTPSIEFALVSQILHDKDGVYGNLIDQFYFEYHVHLGELAGPW